MWCTTENQPFWSSPQVGALKVPWGTYGPQALQISTPADLTVPCYNRFTAYFSLFFDIFPAPHDVGVGRPLTKPVEMQKSYSKVDSIFSTIRARRY